MTDADALLGYLNPARFLDGRIQLRLDLAAQAMREHLADPLFGGDVVAAAAGVRQVVDSQMGDLIRKATLERGYDPRDFVLAAYGGAGPVHAASYARAAGVRNVMVPLSATAFSAYGVVISDTVRSVQRSISVEDGRDGAKLTAAYAAVCRQAVDALAAQDVDSSTISLNRWADMRYERQLHDVRVHLEPSDGAGSLVDALTDAFASRYELLFGKTARLKDSNPRILRIGVDASAGSGITVEASPGVRGGEPDRGPHGDRAVYWPEAGGWIETAIYDGDALFEGHCLRGPAIVEQPGTSVVIPPGATAHVDELRNLIIALAEDGDVEPARVPATVEGGRK